MYRVLMLLILSTLLCTHAVGYLCPQISQFYIDCSNLRTINQSMALCSQLGMQFLNLTDSTTAANVVQYLQSMNCTGNFWFANGTDTVLVGNIGTATGGLLCSVTSLLTIYCVLTTVVQANTICMRTNQIELQQKCPNSDSNQRFDLQQFTFIRTTTFSSAYKIFPTLSQSQCASICAKNDQCIGTTCNQTICTLYI